jgi:hypothetical protein
MVHDVRTHKDIKTPSYEAVSYYWGNSARTLQLVCDNHTLKITANVDTLLRHLRKKEDPRWLWIDAICINQEDDADKAQQVPRMDAIFGRAKKVHVWLGEEEINDNVSSTFEYLGDAASAWNVKSGKEKSTRSLSIEQATMVARLFSRPWFCRRWALQEVAVAQDVTVHCGSFKLPWGSFMVFPNAVRSSTTSNSGMAQHLPKNVIDAIRAPVLLEQRQYDIFDLIRRCHLHECKDERDRLFSLYGMASIYSGELRTRLPAKDFFPVTYEQPWVDIYISFAWNSVRVGNGHKILEHVFEFGSLYHQNSSWPSWAPSWNYQRRLNCPFSTKNAIEWNGSGWDASSFSGKMGITISGNASAKLQLVPWPSSFSRESPRHLYIHFFSQMFSALSYLVHHKSIIHDLNKLSAYYGNREISATADTQTVCCPTGDHNCKANHLLKNLKLFRTQCLNYDVVGLGAGSIRPEDLVVSASSWSARGEPTPKYYLKPKSFAFLVRPAPDIPTDDADRGCIFRLVG